VYNTCWGFVRNPEDAEDLAQEVFVEVHHSIKGFRADAKLSSWIYRISVTKSLEFLRKKKRKKRFALIQRITGNANEELHPIPDNLHPGIQLEQKERAQLLFAAIDKLPDNQRIAFTMHKVEGLPYQEIAEIMDMTLSSVESLMFRAKKNLQKLLGDYYRNNE